MTERSADGQDALRLLSRAARALAEERTVSTEGLLPAWRALAPSFHPLAGADLVDVALLARCHAMGGDALLAARTLRAVTAPARAPVRVVPSVRADRGDGPALAGARDAVLGEALALALALSLEAAKLKHGLTAPADALRAAFPTPAAAERALAALRGGGDARDVDAAAFLDAASSRVNGGQLALLARDRPTYVIAGAGAHRVHDLLSPFARRLRTELAALAGGAPAGVARGDEVYAAIAALYAADDAQGVDDERAGVEATDGFIALGPGALAVRCEQLAESEVDVRVREAATALKRGRALLVLVEERGSSLAAVLEAAGAAVRAALCVVDASDDAAPGFVSESASGHVVAIANALREAGDAEATCATLPSVALGGPAASGLVDDGLFPLTQAILHARATGTLSSTARLGLKTVRTGDVSRMSTCCIDLLARLGPPKAPRR